MTSLAWAVVLITVSVLVSVVEATTLKKADLIPCGVGNGEVLSSPKSDLIDLKGEYHYGGLLMKKFKVSKDGYLELHGEDTVLKIDPYYAWVDDNCGETVCYRQTTNSSILTPLKNQIQSASAHYRGFNAVRAIVVSWQEMVFLDATDQETTNEKNTFQLALVSNADGSETFAVFSYVQLEWTSRIPKRPTYALAFMLLPNGSCYNLPGSNTTSVADLATTSNIGEPGRWVYKISLTVIQSVGVQSSSGICYCCGLITEFCDGGQTDCYQCRSCQIRSPDGYRCSTSNHCLDGSTCHGNKCVSSGNAVTDAVTESSLVTQSGDVTTSTQSSDVTTQTSDVTQTNDGVTQTSDVTQSNDVTDSGDETNNDDVDKINSAITNGNGEELRELLKGIPGVTDLSDDQMDKLLEQLKKKSKGRRLTVDEISEETKEFVNFENSLAGMILSNLVFVIVGAVVLVALVGAASWFYFCKGKGKCKGTRKKKNKPESTTEPAAGQAQGVPAGSEPNLDPNLDPNSGPTDSLHPVVGISYKDLVTDRGKKDGGASDGRSVKSGDFKSRSTKSESTQDAESVVTDISSDTMSQESSVTSSDS